MAQDVASLARFFARTRAQVVADDVYEVEQSARLVLRTLAVEGPLRSGALAELIQSDPSTVSRQVAAVVRDGLVERRADPDDGRASLLVLTAMGEGLVEQHEAARLAWFARLLSNWDEFEVRQFASLLTKFVGDFNEGTKQWAADLAARQSRGIARSIEQETEVVTA